MPAARFLTSPSHVLLRVSGENEARKSTNCADRRGPAFEGRPDHKSPDFEPTRKSSTSGYIVGEIRKSGSRRDVIEDSGGAFSDVSIARFTGGVRRKRGPEIGNLRRPTGART